jgi:hypothetical protein
MENGEYTNSVNKKNACTSERDSGASKRTERGARRVKTDVEMSAGGKPSKKNLHETI